VTDPIRTIIVEDEPLYRQLLATSLGTLPRIQVLDSFSHGAEALSHLERLQPDVVLMDIQLATGDTGVVVGLKMRQKNPNLGIVLLSNHDEPGILKLIPRTEISGWCYLLKQSASNVQVVARAIEAAANGLVVLDSDLVRAYEPSPTSAFSGLTARQQELLALIAQGYSNLAIAQAMGITVKSVENYITQLYQSLHIEAHQDGLHPRVSAVLLYLNDFTTP